MVRRRRRPRGDGRRAAEHRTPAARGAAGAAARDGVGRARGRTRGPGGRVLVAERPPLVVGRRVTGVVDAGAVALASTVGLAVEGHDVAGEVARPRRPGATLRTLVVLLVRLGRRRPDRPDRHRAGDTDEPAADAQRIRVLILAGTAFSSTEPLAQDVAAGAEVGLDGDVRDADVHAGGEADHADAESPGEGEGAHPVGGGDGDALVRGGSGDDPAGALVDRGVARDERLDHNGEQVDPDATGKADEAARHSGRDAERPLGRRGLHGEPDEPGHGAEAAVGVDGAVVDAGKKTALAERDHDVAAAEVGLGVLRDDGHADARADADVEPGAQGRRDEDGLGGVGGGHQNVAGAPDRRPGAGVRLGGHVEDGDLDRPGDAAAGRADGRGGRHGDDRLLAGRHEGHVGGRVDDRAVADRGAGGQRDDAHRDTGAGGRGAADRGGRGDAELAERVPPRRPAPTGRRWRPGRWWRTPRRQRRS